MRLDQPIDIDAFIRDSIGVNASGGGIDVGDHGDMLYQGPSGLGAVPATLGSGYMVMVSRGVGAAPEMIDLISLISFLTGGDSVARTVLFSIISPSISGSGAVSSATAASGSDAYTVIMPSISGSGSAATAAAQSGSSSMSVSILTFSGSGTIVP